MAGDEMQFPVPDVERHAGSVDGIADSVMQARAAVAQVTMSSQAYGQLCQFLPGLLGPLFDQAVRAMDDATDSLRGTADNLRAAAASAATSDGRAGERVSGAGVPLIELPL